MRSLLRSVFALSVLVLPVAGHAATVTYAGNAVLTDLTNGNNVNFSGDTSFSFTNPPNTSETVYMTIDATTLHGSSCSNCTDSLSVDVVFYSPNYNGANYITGTGTLSGTISSTGAIDWTGGENQTVTFTDGTSVTIDLADISAGSFTEKDDKYTASDALTITVVDPPPAAATPEPSSLLLLGTGALGAAGAIRRRLSL